MLQRHFDAADRRIRAVDLSGHLELRDRARIRIDHIGLWIKVIFPHILKQHGPCDDLTGVTHKVFKQPEFARVKEANRTVKLPVAEVFRSASGLVLLCIGANTIGIAGVYFTNTFMIAYTTQYVGVSRSLILDSLFAVAIIQFIAQPLAAWIAERIGGARFLKIAALLAMLSPYPMFMLVQGGTSGSLVAGIALAVVCMAGFYSVIAGFVSGVFPAHVRYSAISLAYQVCGAIAGGLTPLVGTWLAHRFAGQWWPLAVFYTCLAGISLLCIVALDARRAGRPAAAEALGSH